MSKIHMNFKQFGVLLSISTILGMNVVASKALAQETPSIIFGKAIAVGGCIVEDQLPGADGRTLAIILDETTMTAKEGERKRCILRINATIPSGYRAQKLQVLYQGSTDVNSGSKGTSLSRSFNFAGGALGVFTTVPKSTSFTSSELLFQQNDEIDFTSNSCGGEGQFGINLIAQSSPGSSIIVDSSELNAGAGNVICYFPIVRC
ncbi:DUF4360 domain-containing protein [Nostoc sp. CHAB 5715]|uniref:DUF4360 domain-containing protein n=1 Tax=Nostoc sp. CHAB 5715 TaxID=2780400 RepID=UPI001E4A1646|nr:DUF4360 domain-containing protein [Nostoc sp. CHAB 5715]MCC5626568.1 DUF4360 domain-containing protein [Nostoc sp. CHAB 5715]